MFDMTNRVSFTNVSKWKRDFDMKCIAVDSQPTPCLLVANKVFVNNNYQVQPKGLNYLSGLGRRGYPHAVYFAQGQDGNKTCENIENACTPRCKPQPSVRFMSSKYARVAK
jgi:hypothetical protein